MFLADFKIYALIFLGLIAFLAVVGLITVAVYLAVKKYNSLNEKQKILHVRGKFLPMWGDYYLYRDASTGTVMGDCIGDKCEFFDNEEDAKKIIRMYVDGLECA
ncbi:MAG TPA: hypothetical protein PLB59_10180 [Bacteroidales bacterium]|jgi:hypothetical protein|nr:hypothetical protein [Bacteroidales bacterium]